MATTKKETSDQKAERLLFMDAVTEIESDRVFYVRGDSRIYAVVVHCRTVDGEPFGGICPCKHGREQVEAGNIWMHEGSDHHNDNRCSHLKAAMQKARES